MPIQSQAGFFSGILGNEASASIDTVNSNQDEKNSQNMALLQANVSPISITQDKQDKTAKKVAQVDEDQSINIVSDNALLPSTSLMSVSGNEAESSSPDQISVYVVRKGDSIAQIAEMFNVSVNTILMANDMKKGQKLKEGETLLILPISGSEHTVTKGQTIASIAKLYKVDIEDITSYNGIATNSKLAVGDKLMIPGGDTMKDEGGDKPAPNLGASVAKDINYYLRNPIQNLIGYFINPVPTGRKTQGLHGPGNRGIDIGAPTGTPIYASAPGAVLAVKTGCKVGYKSCGGGYGNMVIVQHPNGTKTLYAHMSKVGTRTGDQVNRGEMIGAVGNTGRSTGPHIHFEVFNAKNPGVDWSWAN
jgi:murein DD-endopeptidase MepM/ murein hydrolase activator NlpD